MKRLTETQKLERAAEYGRLVAVNIRNEEWPIEHLVQTARRAAQAALSAEPCNRWIS